MHYLSLVAIIKDEDSYLQEYIEYYLIQGVEHFYFYDNESEVPLTKCLSAYKKICTINTVKGYAQQIPAYNHFIKNYGNQTKWAAFFDIDEFVYPKAHPNLKDFLQENEKKTDCLAINWVMFGHSTHISPPLGPVLKNYQFSEGTMHPNTKCVVQTSALRKFDNPHYPTLKLFKKQTNAKGNRVFSALNLEDCTDLIQLNHYFTKSLEEYQRKLNRPRADTGIPRSETKEDLKWILDEPQKSSAVYNPGIWEKYGMAIEKRLALNSLFL